MVEQRYQRSYQSIQMMRAVASLAVVIAHFIPVALSPYADRLSEASKVSAFLVGQLGVDVFFVISGFVVALLLNREATDAGVANIRVAGFFLARRALRIYPVFWITIAAMGGLLLSLGRPAPMSELLDLRSLLLINGHPQNPPSWTLLFELRFYLFAAVALLFGRHARKAMIWWAAINTVLAILVVNDVIPLFDPILFGTTSAFMTGMFLGFFPTIPKLSRPWTTAFAAISASILLYLAFEPTIDQGFTRFFYLGVPATFLVWAALSWELSGGKVPLAISRLGDISYSVYIWHWMVLIGLISMTGLHPVVFVLVGLGATLLISAASYYAIERPINHFASTRLRATTSHSGPMVDLASAPMAAASSRSASASSA